MDVTVIVAIIGAIEGIGVAIIGAFIARENRRAEGFRKTQDERAARREERDTALYGLMFATASGTEVLLRQAHGEKINGNVDSALESIESAKSKCNELFNQSAAKM